MKKLKEIGNSLFETPNSLTIPFATFSKFFSLDDKSLVEKLNLADFDEIVIKSKEFRKEFEDKCNAEEINLNSLYKDIFTFFKNGENVLYAIRSSSNLEDLNKNAGAGLFDSFLGINLTESKQVTDSIISVWVSLFTERGVLFRKKNKISNFYGKMGVLIQEMINPEISFIIHTVNPISKDKNEIYIELAFGLGETLASANLKGSPFRIIFYKDNSKFKISNYSSYSKGLFRLGNEISYKFVCFKEEKMFNDKDYLDKTIGTLGLIAQMIEKKFENPQDIEGCIMNGKIYLVQTRPQII